MSSTELLLIAAYLVIAFATLRMQILVHIRLFPKLKWGGSDSFGAVYFSAIWPITMWLLWPEYFEIKYPRFRGPIARLFDHEQRKAEARKNQV